MHLDKYGLPVQADGDANDQLQRVSMIYVAHCLGAQELWDVPVAHALAELLQPSPGVFVRHVGGNPNNVSADQLIAALCAFVVVDSKTMISRMFTAMCKRLGFAQNYKDGLDGSDSKTKLPDFMLFRALPLFARVSRWLYPLAIVLDIFLIGLSLSAIGPVLRDGSLIPRRRGPDDVDHNNTILTLAVCSKRMPTPLSFLARKLFTKFCPWNFGCEGLVERETDTAIVFKEDENAYHPVYGSLRYYHRAESGGNPEIAELWKPICKELFE